VSNSLDFKLFPYQPQPDLDSGGTNLRVGFIELLGSAPASEKEQISDAVDNVLFEDRSRVRRLLEKSWPIGEQLKINKAEDLFAWIGKCIADVVKDGSETWPGEFPDEVPLGVTFSFPMMSVPHSFLLIHTDRLTANIRYPMPY
jgi:hexokinase